MRKTAGAIAGALCAILMICNLPSAQARQFTWLESITTSDQVVLVTANNQMSTTGTLRTFEKFNDQKNLQFRKYLENVIIERSQSAIRLLYIYIYIFMNSMHMHV